MKYVFSLFIFVVDCVLKTGGKVSLHFLKLKLYAKHDTAKERTQLFLFIKCTKEN